MSPAANLPCALLKRSAAEADAVAVVETASARQKAVVMTAASSALTAEEMDRARKCVTLRPFRRIFTKYLCDGPWSVGASVVTLVGLVGQSLLTVISCR
ncbi:hypothetical protein MLGJGCBP_00753 [Rhodococcus sp. T7]|nr:hypothetical protein MLGJGCBP_00753 [Rhodococcus sp. T7]